MPTNAWQGRRVRLRAVEPSDEEAHFAWNQDGEMARQFFDELVFGLTHDEFTVRLQSGL